LNPSFDATVRQSLLHKKESDRNVRMQYYTHKDRIDLSISGNSTCEGVQCGSPEYVKKTGLV
jgi:hypothetical protein